MQHTMASLATRLCLGVAAGFRPETTTCWLIRAGQRASFSSYCCHWGEKRRRGGEGGGAEGGVRGFASFGGSNRVCVVNSKFGVIRRSDSRLSFARLLSTATKETKIGIIGIGQVGDAVAGNLLQKGYQVKAVREPDTPRLAHLPPSVTRCSSPAEVLSLCDVVLTCLPKPEHVKKVAEAPDGLLSAMTPGKIWVDHSTTEYEQTIGYMAEVEARGAYMLESPITGGLDALRKGQMVAYVGGRKEVVDAVMPILEASYMTVFYVGSTVGTAMVIKVVSNMLCCVHVVAMSEALMLGKRANIDLKTFWDGIRLSVGNSFVWETAAPVVFNGGDYDPGFSLSLQNKDLQLGYEMARKFKVPMPIHQHTLSTYRATEYQFGSEAACYIVPRSMELALNEFLQIPGFSKWEYNNVIQDGSLNVTHEGIDCEK